MEPTFLLEKSALLRELGIRSGDDSFQSLKPAKMSDLVDYQGKLRSKVTRHSCKFDARITHRKFHLQTLSAKPYPPSPGSLS